MNLVDPYGRIVDYLRISITDFCNLSWHFCNSCNRLRLTADGKIHTCLFSRDEIDVKTPLHRGFDRQELMTLFRSAVANKPRRHELDGQSRNQMFDHRMYAIGG